MKSLVIGTLMCTALLIANACLLALPVKAADCTAICASGGFVQCSGYACSARDGVGCAAWDNHGRQIIQILCNGY
jgi:hypothetical protein